MGVTEELLNGIVKGKAAYNAASEDIETGAAATDIRSSLAHADNLEYMKQLLEGGYAGAFNMIYIDPPFFTRAKYNATVALRDREGRSHKVRHLVFDDTFERSLEVYIENMTVRLLMMKDLLADDGLLWVHLDWHSSHYIRLVLDEVMGEKNFVNEIIWSYKSGGSGKRHFSRKHDSILVYSKSKAYYLSIPEEKSYNRGFKPYNFKGVKEYRDENGWYTLVNMKDVWSIDMVGRTAAERNGYATQKPLELMKRIVLASTREGDLVGDFFCGSGSMLEAAHMLGRRFAGCDNEKLAVSMARKRLMECGADFGLSGEDGDRSSDGRVDITVMACEILENGRYMVKAGITDYVPEIDTGYIQTGDREYVEEVLRNDVMQLIDYVIIYGVRDGGDMIVRDGFDNMILTLDGDAEAAVVDVFGREYPAVINI